MFYGVSTPEDFPFGVIFLAMPRLKYLTSRMQSPGCLNLTLVSLDDND